MLVVTHGNAFNTLSRCRKSNAPMPIPLRPDHSLHNSSSGERLQDLHCKNSLTSFLMLQQESSKTYFWSEAFQRCSIGCVIKSRHQVLVIRGGGGAGVWLQFKCSDHSIPNHSGLLRTDLPHPIRTSADAHMHNTWQLDLKAYSPLGGRAWEKSNRGRETETAQIERMAKLAIHW